MLLPTTTILLIGLIFLSPTTTASPPVLDVDGNPLEAGSRYYVLTSGRGAAGRGGLTATTRASQPLCPKYVAQHPEELERGRPVSFLHADPSQKEITEDAEVNIYFGLDPICRKNMVWQLNFELGSSIPLISTDGVIGNPGAETFNNWFHIERAPFGPPSYKIVYCFAPPSILPPGTRNCQQLDATIPGRNGWNYLSLVPIDDPLPFFGFLSRRLRMMSLLFNLLSSVPLMSYTN